jgi:TolB-like protein
MRPGLRYVLEDSVRRGGNRLRFTANVRICPFTTSRRAATSAVVWTDV